MITVLMVSALGLVLFAACGKAIFDMIAPPTKARPFPACGQCGYNVVGLTNMRCPECGSHFYDAGVLGTRYTESAGSAISIGMLAWFFISYLCWTLGLTLLSPRLSPMALDIYHYLTGALILLGAIVLLVLRRRCLRRRRIRAKTPRHSQPPPTPQSADTETATNSHEA